jgi:uncharacterized protein (TIGR00269 family)
MRCKCGKRAVYLRRYEGTLLCRECFIRSVESKVKRTIRKHCMVRKRDTVALALSGGKDSTSAAYLIHSVFNSWKDVRLLALTIDEGVEPYRTRNIRKAKKFTGELGMEHHVFSFREEFSKTTDMIARRISRIPRKMQPIQEICTYCGVARRYLLNKNARELGATRLCVGHNLDDEVQAAMLNYMRGDIARAARMEAVTSLSTRRKGGELFIPRIKPLREIPERETALYAHLKGFDILEGSCPHAGGVRFEVREFLNGMELKYPGMKFSILETFDKLNPCMKKQIGRQRSERGESRILKCRICGEPSSRRVCKACELWREKATGLPLS